MVRIRKAQRQVAGKDRPIKLVSGRGFPWTTLAELGHLVPSCISNIRTEIPHVLMAVMLSSTWWKGEWTRRHPYLTESRMTMMRTHMPVILHRHRYNENPSTSIPAPRPAGAAQRSISSMDRGAGQRRRGGRDRSENGRVLGSTAHNPLGLHYWRFIDIRFLDATIAGISNHLTKLFQ